MMKRNEFLAVVCMAAGSLLMQGAIAESACASKSGNVRDGKPLKVLMVGNSFSVCVLKQMPRCAADAGEVLDIASLFIGGCPLKKHWSNLASVSSDNISLFNSGTFVDVIRFLINTMESMVYKVKVVCDGENFSVYNI